MSMEDVNSNARECVSRELPGQYDGRLDVSTKVKRFPESLLWSVTATVMWRCEECECVGCVDELEDESECGCEDCVEGVCVDEFCCGSVLGDNQVRWVDGRVLARAEVWVFDGSPVCWGSDFGSLSPADRGALGDVLSQLADECDVVSHDLHSASLRLFDAFRAGQLDGVPCGAVTSRWVILDNVWVDAAVRGFGLGRGAAAHALYVAGAWSEVAIVALPGALPDLDQFPPVGPGEEIPGYAEAWEKIHRRAVKLLESFNLTGVPAGLHVGHTSMQAVYGTVRDAAFCVGDDLPWVSTP